MIYLLSVNDSTIFLYMRTSCRKIKLLSTDDNILCIPILRLSTQLSLRTLRLFITHGAVAIDKYVSCKDLDKLI